MAGNSGSAKSGNFILKLYRGELSLWVAYWVLGWGSVVLISSAMPIVEGVIDRATATSSLGLQIVLMLVCGIVFAFEAIVAIGIWRSAGKYQGSLLWASLARLGVVVMVLAALSGVIAEFSRP